MRLMEIEIEIDSGLMPLIEVMAEREGVSVEDFARGVFLSEIKRMAG